jgi:hypothetical protein
MSVRVVSPLNKIDQSPPADNPWLIHDSQVATVQLLEVGNIQVIHRSVQSFKVNVVVNGGRVVEYSATHTRGKGTLVTFKPNLVGAFKHTTLAPG